MKVLMGPSPQLAKRMAARAVGTCVLLACANLSGCATTSVADDAAPNDPLERWNRGVYSFNDGVDRIALKPVARAYGNYVPEPVRTGVHNFLGNFADAWSAVNLMLQGRVTDAFNDGMRVSVNTFLGVAGTLDVATEMRLEGHKQDLGLTLGHWGVGSGPYIVWPLLGPSTLRDSVNIPFEQFFSAANIVGADMTTTNILTATAVVEKRYTLLPVTDVVEDVAIDPYAFVRDGYLQRRQNLIEDGLSRNQDEEPPQVSRAAPLVQGELPSISVATNPVRAVIAPKIGMSGHCPEIGSCAISSWPIGLAAPQEQILAAP